MEREKFLERIQACLEKAYEDVKASYVDSVSFLASERIDDSRVTCIVIATKNQGRGIDITAKIKTTSPQPEDHETYMTRITWLDKESYTLDEIIERISEEF